MKKILICGFGKMGLAHLSSFENKKNCKVFLYDKFLSKKEIVKRIKYKKIDANYEILKKFPERKSFFSLILSTHSKDRYKMLSKLIDKNKIKYFLLEKFVFLKAQHYEHIEKNINKKRILVNVWGNILRKILKINLNKQNYRISVLLPTGSLLTNLIHYVYFFSKIVKSKKIQIKLNSLKQIKSKRDKSSEFIGSIDCIHKNSFLKIKTQDIDSHVIKILNKKKHRVVKIDFPYIKEKNKKLYFPSSKMITYKNIIGIDKNIGLNKLPYLADIKNISILILKQFSNYKNLTIN